jgi:predicted ferric reductase
MDRIGYAAAVTLCAAAVALAVAATAAHGVLNTIGVAAGAVSIAAMTGCLLLAARPRGFEPFFGGLDRMYRVHKWLGITALAAMVAHDMVGVEFGRRVRGGDGLGEIAESFGSVALYGLVGLVLLSWVKRIPGLGLEIPYHLWWITHRFMGGFFLLAVLHQQLVSTPWGAGEPLAVFLAACGLVGIGSYVFVETVARRWRRRPYEVVSVERDGPAATLRLRPLERPIRWRPGQFAFLSEATPRVSEAHPFTISGAPQPDGTLTFAIKPLGDWTRRAPERLATGTTVWVEGPYGRFDFRKGRDRQVWIAGGVGVTPFLAWVRSLSPEDRVRAHLVCCVRREEEAIGLDVLRDAAARLPSFSFDLWTDDRGLLDAGRLLPLLPFDPDGADFYFCGPPGLRESVVGGLHARGVRPGGVHFEVFEFR